MKKLLFPLSLLFALVTSCAPTPAPVYLPTLAPTDAASSAVAMIDSFYTVINTAQTKDDLSKLWNMLTLDEQCNALYQCNMDRFQDKLWQAKGPYRLYDCGSNIIVAEETRYPQSDSSSATPDAPRFWHYELMQTEDGFLISDVSVAQAPGEGCVPVVDGSVTP